MDIINKSKKLEGTGNTDHPFGDEVNVEKEVIKVNHKSPGECRNELLKEESPSLACLYLMNQEVLWKEYL